MKDQITYLPDNADRSVAKQKFKITNWPTYNKALINRGSITFWLDDEAIQAWYESATPSSRGRPQRYSDLAITTVLVIKRVFRLTLRAAQGFIDSIFSLMNVPLRCPDYSCVSRRAKSVNMALLQALLQRLAAVRGRLSLCADQAAAAKWWLSMPMASVSAEGPMPKALSTRRTSPLMPGCRHQGRACPLRRARMTSNPLIVA